MNNFEQAVAIVARDFPHLSHGEVREQLRALGAQFAAESAAAERARIEGILSMRKPGCERLCYQMAFDGKTTIGEAAQQVLATERQFMPGYSPFGES